MQTDAPPHLDGAWQPSAEHLRDSKILQFASRHGFRTVRELVERADADPAWFWGEVADWLDLDWQTPPVRVVDNPSGGPDARWFPGAEVNVADNAVDRWVRRGRASEVALHWETDEGQRGRWTFSELAHHVDAFGRGLIRIGVRPGDRVGLQLPMVKESAVAMLACAKVGAVCVPVFSGFGPAAVVDRLGAAGASVHIVAGAYVRRGKRIDVRSALADELRALPDLRSTIVVDAPGEAEDKATRFPHEISWESLTAGHDGKGPLEAVATPGAHPWLLAFTSGSTGRPKGVVLSHAGFAVKAGSDATFSFNLGPSDTAAWITDPGWIMFPITLVGGLIAGSAVGLFGGTPDHPTTGRVWDFCRVAEVTMLGLSPTLVRTLMGGGAPAPVSRTALRLLASSGEPWTPDAYQWLFRGAFDGRLPIINYSGGTEVSGGIVSNTTAEPIHPCAFAGPMPGMGAVVVDAVGREVDDGIGELALRHASPGMPLTFWEDHQRYVDTYWTAWPGLWRHGDWIELIADRWYIRGRSDDTLKIAGKRIGPAEVESVVNGVDGVVESAAVGVPDGIKGDALVVFARLDPSVPGETAAADHISEAVGSQLGRALRPREVHVVDTLPRTRSGKIMRRVIRAAYCKEPLGDLSSLENPEAITHIAALR